MNSDSRHLSSLAFLWPALAAEAASELALATAREFVGLAMGVDADTTKVPEPQWTTSNKVALELRAVRLRDFSIAATGPATLVCAPYALHGATIVDFAPGHSLVHALQRGGISPLFVTDWRSATPDMRHWGIDDYIAAVNVLVDELGGSVSLIAMPRRMDGADVRRAISPQGAQAGPRGRSNRYCLRQVEADGCRQQHTAHDFRGAR